MCYIKEAAKNVIFLVVGPLRGGGYGLNTKGLGPHWSDH